MTVRDTSLKAFMDFSHTGLADAQIELYKIICTHPNITNNEIKEKIGWEINRITPRVKELREMGLVQEVGKRPDNFTGILSYSWRAV